MEISTFKSVIQDQELLREALARNEKIIERELGTKKIERQLAHPNVLTVLGPRRCGKSVLAWLSLSGKKYARVNFDDERLYAMRSDDLNRLLQAIYELYGDVEYLIFDEIQNVPAWELFITRLRDAKRIIITGSNSALLSGELATHLTGRHTDITLFPFSFIEFLRYRGEERLQNSKAIHATETAARANVLLEEYMFSGGFPEVYKFGQDRAKTIFHDTISKDIVKRYKIRNLAAMEEIAMYLTMNSSGETSYSKLMHIFGVKNIQTIKNYVRYMEEAYLLLILDRFSPKLKQAMIAPKKVYSIDTGLIHSLDPGRYGEPGRLMENMVAVELFRRRAYNADSTEICYWKDHQQREVDFVVRKGSTVLQLIQVSYSVAVDKTRAREVRALISAAGELRCSSMLVITWDYEAVEHHERKKVVFMPLWKWLLKK